MLWKSPTAWREEIRFSDFSQVQIADVNKLYKVRSTPFLPFEMYHLRSIVDFSSLLRLDPGNTAKIIKSRGKDSAYRTVEIDDPSGGQSKRIFLDVSAPVPDHVEYPGATLKYEFGDYVEFEGHQFPRHVTRFDENNSFIEVQVRELVPAADVDASLIPSPDMRWAPWCPEPDSPTRRVGIVTPAPHPLHYDSNAINRPVVVYGVLGTDGLWHDLTVLKSADKEVDELWLDMLRRQRFYPAKCGVVPVETEQVMEFQARRTYELVPLGNPR